MELAAKRHEANPNNEELKQSIISKQKEMRIHYETMECDVKQLSHTNWLQLGDNHITFFGRAVRVRRACNSLMRLMNELGDPYLAMGEAERKEVDFYENLYTQEGTHSGFTPWFPRISLEMNNWLCAPT